MLCPFVPTSVRRVFGAFICHFYRSYEVCFTGSIRSLPVHCSIKTCSHFLSSLQEQGEVLFKLKREIFDLNLAVHSLQQENRDKVGGDDG